MDFIYLRPLHSVGYFSGGLYVPFINICVTYICRYVAVYKNNFLKQQKKKQQHIHPFLTAGM